MLVLTNYTKKLQIIILLCTLGFVFFTFPTQAEEGEAINTNEPTASSLDETNKMETPINIGESQFLNEPIEMLPTTEEESSVNMFSVDIPLASTDSYSTSSSATNQIAEYNLEKEIVLEGESMENNNLNINQEIKLIPTNIIRGINNNRLSILASWQMSSEKIDDKYSGKDDSGLATSQLLPSGKFNVTEKVVFCSLVTEKNENDISVSVKTYYPSNSSVLRNGTELSCGKQKNELNLQRLDQQESLDLVCDKIRGLNNNLISWGRDKVEDYQYDYDQVCGDQGAISISKASVYCAEEDFAYNDPAGDYNIQIKVSNSTNEEDLFEHQFKYLELTMFENDFSNVQYGQVSLGEWQPIFGDSIFGTSNAPSLRNIGNTVLKIKIQQNDFGFGKTDGIWNINYRARVGSAEIFNDYQPGQSVLLSNPIALGETINLDLLVQVIKFPIGIDNTAWSGDMVILAEKESFPTCY